MTQARTQRVRQRDWADRRPRVGVVGTGFIGQVHAQAWARLDVDLRIWGRSGADAVATMSGATRCDDFDDLLDSVDIVDICLPTDLHQPFALAAAARGRHVVCEKPLALTVTDAEAIAAACAEAGVGLYIGHVVRYYPEYHTVRSAVAQGKVGDVALVRLARESALPERAAGAWIFDEARSGGIIADLMSHDIDFASWLSGPVVRVYTKTLRVMSDLVDDHAYAVLTHASGSLSHLTASWAQPAARFRTRIEVAGTSGMLAYDSDSAQTLTVSLRQETPVTGAGLPGRSGQVVLGDDPFTAQLRDFLAGIRTGTPARTSVQDSIATVRTIEAARESARTGRAVSLEEAAS
ncbi:gfo/Idh/MocA family oxidoreductase [Nonomuraea sp. WAC 01424]|uniref:Gfo/Idh/MocA family protein n=1 Tax=Nonomuraea sp. WAC 01424 TaxID=2203200 RepID=UPI000F7A7CA5|nr:Gfo/Idh/MocA family oxidoreductase [Nonomuraea sp. WAC 01424]RSN15558.1 gfo/Idh/MocA family oxidoreductase [Nonomuraea sp. WAC 01424]